MSSSLIVPVAKVQKVREHPNASLLCIAEILGWKCVVPMRENPDGEYVRVFVSGERDEKGKRIPIEEGNPQKQETETIRFSPVHQEEDVVVYFPPDSMLPREWAEKFGITGYLSFKKDDPDFGRIRCAKLRGEPSFGVVVAPPENVSWEVGDNVAEYYGAKKYEPPFRPNSGDMEAEHSSFPKYTDIENLRNFPDILSDGEEVVVTEKIHGSNFRSGIVEVGSEEDGQETFQTANGNSMMFVAGSHTHRRKIAESEEERKRNLYNMPLTIPAVEKLLLGLAEDADHQVILFGEVYGSKVQGGFNYDAGKGLGFRAFDLFIDGKYLSYDEFKKICDEYGVETVPLIYRGPFDMQKIHSICNQDGHSMIGQHMIEGGVVRPVVERVHPAIGRVVLKYLADDYLVKNKTDFLDR